MLVAFGCLALASMLYVAFANYLFAGDQRVVVVTMQPDTAQSARTQLKQACGSLPGVGVVGDRGNADASVRGMFPVRFDISGSSPREQAALETCINDNGRFVRGFLTEGDGH